MRHRNAVIEKTAALSRFSIVHWFGFFSMCAGTPFGDQPTTLGRTRSKTILKKEKFLEYSEMD